MSSNRNSTNSFLRLPSLVIEVILTNLHVSNLRRLRAVCRKTKSWIDDDPIQLNKIKLYVGSQKRLGEIMNSSKVKWSHAVVPISIWNSMKLAEFLQQFPITAIKISGNKDANMFGDAEFTCALSPLKIMSPLLNLQPSTLESLSIYTKASAVFPDPSYDSHYAKIVSAEFQKWFKQEKDHLILKLSRVEILTFKKMNMSCPTQVNDLIIAFLSVCQSLTTLKLPFISEYCGYNDKMNTGPELYLEEPFSRTIFNHVEDRLGKLTTIDFGEICLSRCRRSAFLKSDQIYSACDIETSDLLKLAKFFCRDQGQGQYGQLLNVPISAFPNSGALKMEDKTRLSKCVKSIVCIGLTTGVPDGTDTWIPPMAELHIAFLFPYSVEPNIHQYFTLPSRSNIGSIIIDGYYDTVDPPNYIEQLLQIPHPTVQKLCIFYPGFMGNDFQLATIFPNLKKLHLKFILDTEWLENLLTGLHNLEDLTLQSCKLNSKLFHGGTASPLFNHMKNLVRVNTIGCFSNLIG